MQLQGFEVHVFASELEERFEGCGKFNGRFRPLKITAKRKVRVANSGQRKLWSIL